MTKEEEIKKNRELVEKYPFLLFDYDPLWAMKFPEESIYDRTWLDDIDNGWRKAFGEDFCNELFDALINADYLDDFHFLQIKEKFGALRLYFNGWPATEHGDKIIEVVSKYEELSKYICGYCGKPARYITKGWIYPLCEDCIKEVNGGYVPIEEFYGFKNYDEVLKEIDDIKNNFQYDNYWKEIK